MIETARLILRQWRDADAAPFAALNADPEVMAHFETPLSRATSDTQLGWYRGAIAAHGWGLWAVERRDDGMFLGFTGLWTVNFAAPIEGDIEIGWRLARQAWGKGYATEAARAAVAFGWANTTAPRLVAMTVPANTRSIRVMEKLGLERRPGLDFAHPRLPDGHPLKAHIVHAIDRP